MLKSLLFFFGLAIAALTAQAYEVDDFYCAQKLASQPQAVSKDVEARLNAFTEEKLKEAVEAINGKILEEIEKGRVNHTTCDDWGTKYNYLLKSVRKRLSSGVISELENFASENLQGQVWIFSPMDAMFVACLILARPTNRIANTKMEYWARIPPAFSPLAICPPVSRALAFLTLL